MKIEFPGRIDKADVIGYIGAQPAFFIAKSVLKKAIKPKTMVGQAVVASGAAIVEVMTEQGIKTVVRMVDARKEGKKYVKPEMDYVVVNF